jgi:hypothetical protein
MTWPRRSIVPCINESSSTSLARRCGARWSVALVTAIGLAACSSDGAKAPVSSAPSQPVGEATTADTSSTTIAAVNPRATTPGAITLPPPGPVRTWEHLRVQAAKRIVAANPSRSYTSPAPDVLLAIPVLEIELNADGSIRRIGVLRYPGQAKDTTQLAIDAVRRAAPFGDVSKLSKPWKFSETFLFNDDRQFKPRSLE